jgi:HSP20 family protein
VKNEGVSPNRVVPISIHPAAPKDLLAEMCDWSDRISKRAYELFLGRGATLGRELDDWISAERELLKPIALEVQDRKDEFIVKAEIPGFEAKDIDLQVDGSRLVIKGHHDAITETREKETKMVFTERKATDVYRMIDLGAPILADRAKADLKNGLLELRLPKGAAKTTAIKVTAA